ncbi:MAG: hypothetical protein ACD_4C00443G0001 [uncultured bacterium (gcode 4)]|uniref:Uncharacterized protein n=1 Tax=uncultured bacterium (gcode 4) TaxID=1234023 RepID=K2F4R9_9BACT|nr:MAG: hypothetical protein ACD_4C00443G0001 [uncultured bacterium (gcode 4)]
MIEEFICTWGVAIFIIVQLEMVQLEEDPCVYHKINGLSHSLTVR